MKKAIIIGGLLLLLSAGGAAGYFIMAGKEPVVGADGAVVPEPEKKMPPIFLKLSPAIVVNFSYKGELRYLQTTLELMHTDQDVVDELELNIPVIRNNLIMLLSDKTFEELSSKSAKADLRVEIGEAVSQVVELETPAEVYITSFVMQ